MRPVCLDVTRLARRSAIVNMTGIDRVELSYLNYFLTEKDRPVFGVVRTRRRLLLLDRSGLEAVHLKSQSAEPWGPAPWWAHMSSRDTAVLAAERVLNDLAYETASIGMAFDVFSSVFPAGTLYLNTGHTNLNADLFGALAGVPDLAAAVLIHDTIPLDRPETQRAGTPTVFERRLRNALTFASRIITPSLYVEERLAHYAERWSLAPEVKAAPLGITLVSPEQQKTGAPGSIYFVAIGTIEPRKNHALLLDVWEALPASDRPELYIVGRRGWRNEKVFARLDRGVPGVHEISDLGDPALAGLLQTSAGLLQPSLDEGFGLPPHEAAARGVVPVCTPLPVYRETLGPAGIYVDPANLYEWRKVVLQLAERRRCGVESSGSPIAGYVAPTWDDHFKKALTGIC